MKKSSGLSQRYERPKRRGFAIGYTVVTTATLKWQRCYKSQKEIKRIRQRLERRWPPRGRQHDPLRYLYANEQATRRASRHTHNATATSVLIRHKFCFFSVWVFFTTLFSSHFQPIGRFIRHIFGRRFGFVHFFIFIRKKLNKTQCFVDL